MSNFGFLRENKTKFVNTNVVSRCQGWRLKTWERERARCIILPPTKPSNSFMHANKWINSVWLKGNGLIDWHGEWARDDIKRWVTLACCHPSLLWWLQHSATKMNYKTPFFFSFTNAMRYMSLLAIATVFENQRQSFNSSNCSAICLCCVCLCAMYIVATVQ